MNFRYHALDPGGKAQKGLIEAENEAIAKNEIKKRGLYLVSIKGTATREQGPRRFLFSFGLRQWLPIQLARQLSSLLKGGVPLFQALTIINNQLEGENERIVVGYLGEQVRGGTALSQALKAYPGIFDNLFIYSVQAGEKTGALDSILSYQADLLEHRAALRGKVKAALVYPAIMAVVGSGVLLFLIGYVVPMVIRIFDRMNHKLPLVTQLLISTTGFINNYLLILTVSLTLAVIGLSQWVRRSPTGKRTWDRIALYSPVFGRLYQMILISRFTKIMGTMLKSGIHMLQSLMVVSSTMKNGIVSEAIMKMAEMVERGSDFSVALRQTSIFPSYVADMASVGETSGNLEDMLANVSAYYETNANQRIQAMTAMVEPFIIVAMGAIIAFILVSILLPLFEMNKILVK